MNASTGRQISAGNRAQRRATAKANGRKRVATAAQVSATGLILAAGIGVLGVAPVQAGLGATSFVVTNLGDAPLESPEAYGTLRWAINNANSLSGAQTITFQPGLTGSIVLAQGQLEINDSVTISGPGSSTLSIDGGGLSRVIEASGIPGQAVCVSFGPGYCLQYEYIPGAETDVTVSGLTITGGNSGAADGGGIAAVDVGLSLVNVAVVDNVTASGDGGGLSFDGDEDPTNSLSVAGSQIKDNAANRTNSSKGGGIYVEHTNDEAGVSIVDSTISGNHAGEDGGGFAVASVASGGSLTIANSTISGNDALYDGGGIDINSVVSGATVHITNSHIETNTAFYYGGGIRIGSVDAGADVTLAGSFVSGNTSDDDGGGIYIEDLSGAVSILDTEIADNTSSNAGGGISVNSLEPEAALTVDGSTILRNDAGDDGGGISVDYNRGSVAIVNTPITENTADGSGGGVFLRSGFSGPFGSSGSLEIADSTISGNEATVGGGVATDRSADLEIFNSTVADNIAQNSGGGISLGSGGPFWAPGSPEPAAFHDTYGEVTIIGTTISGNSVTAGNGGGLTVGEFGRASISESTISGNTATGDGGGLLANAFSSVDLEHSTIADNTADGQGGGIAAHELGSVHLNHVIVGDNSGATGFANLGGAGSGPPGLGGPEGRSFSLSYSVIEDAASELIAEGAVSSTIGEDAQLGALQDNGGPTKTHLITGTSPAANAGNPEYLTEDSDQRGSNRLVGVIDIGAVEMDFGSIEFVANSATVSEETGTLVVELRRTGEAEGAVTAEVTPAAGTATAGADFNGSVLSATWADGESGVKSVNLGVVLDGDHEESETLTLGLETFEVPIGEMSSMAVTITNSNTAPTIVDIADVSVSFGTTTVEVPMKVGDAEQSAVTVTVTSSNQSVVANADLSVSGTGAARVLSARPVSGATGSTTVTVTVSDGVLSTVDTFTLSVGAQPTLPPPPVATVDGVLLVNGVGTTTDSTPTLSGTGEAGAEVKVYITGNTLLAENAAPAGIEVCSTAVTAGGTWSCTLANGLPVGNYSLSVVQTRGGQVSSSSSLSLQIVSAGGQLPKTGGDPRTAAWFGVGLLGLGATLTGAGRRRRRTTN
jgi:hypothetical protein